MSKEKAANDKKQDHLEHQEQEEAPPFFKRWSYLYAVVIAELALLICLFYWFSISFS